MFQDTIKRRFGRTVPARQPTKPRWPQSFAVHLGVLVLGPSVSQGNLATQHDHHMQGPRRCMRSRVAATSESRGHTAPSQTSCALKTRPWRPSPPSRAPNHAAPTPSHSDRAHGCPGRHADNIPSDPVSLFPLQPTWYPSQPTNIRRAPLVLRIKERELPLPQERSPPANGH